MFLKENEDINLLASTPSQGCGCCLTLRFVRGNDLSLLQGLRRAPRPAAQRSGLGTLRLRVPAPQNNSVGTTRRPLPQGLQIKALIRSKDGKCG